MISRFFVSFFRAHSPHILRIGAIVFLSSFAFLLTASITALVQDTIQSETRTLLGADIILESSQAASEGDIMILQELEQRYDIIIASTIEFQSNIEIDERPYLTDIKIISPNYPLISESVGESSGVLLSESMKQLIEGNTRLSLGESEYEIYGEIPPVGLGSFSLFSEGRELWIPQSIAEISELLGLGARVSYKYFILSDGNIGELREYLSVEGILDDWQVRDIESRQDIISSVFGEFQRFLQVFFTGIFILAFFSLFFTLEALKRIIKRDIGLFILLGYQKKKVFFGLCLIMFGVFILGYLLALACVYLSVDYLQQSFVITQNLSLEFFDIIQSLILSICILVFASLYTLRDFSQSSVLHLLKQADLLVGKNFPTSILLYLLAGIITLLFFLGASFISIVVQSALILGVISLLALCTKLYFATIFRLFGLSRTKYFLLYHTLRACIRPGNMTLFITIPVMIVGTVFFFLLVFAISFLDITRIEEGEESYFILNINSEDQTQLREHLGDIELYDILLARIVAVNNIPLRDFVVSSPRSGEFTREFNLTTNPLISNTYTRGEPLEAGTISLDEDFAQRLGVSIGDEIRFLLAGREVSYTVINTRPAVRGDFRPFFYVQLFPDDVAALERSYFGVLVETDLSSGELRSLLFSISPRLQLLDVTETLEEVTRILSQVYQGVLAIAIYVGVFVWILLSISLTVLSKLRSREAQILSLLGAPKRFTRNFLALEYLVLLSFSLLLIIILGSILSTWFFYNSSLFDFQLSYILQSSVILLAGGVGLYISVLLMQERPK